MSKRFSLVSSFVLAAASMQANAAVAVLQPVERDVVPVFVAVDKKGKVTELLASVRLKPSMERLLERNVTELVASPMIEDGKLNGRQFVVNMKLQSAATSDGKYNVRFVPVDSLSVPRGNWAWSLSGDRYALITDINGYSDAIKTPPASLSVNYTLVPRSTPGSPGFGGI